LEESGEGSYGQACAAATVDSCQTCGRGSYSPSGSITESDCICDSDFRHLNNGSTWTCAMQLAILSKLNIQSSLDVFSDVARLITVFENLHWHTCAVDNNAQ
jgi:hypothetical protein